MVITVELTSDIIESWACRLTIVVSQKNTPAFKEKVSAKDTTIEEKTGDLYQHTSWFSKLCCRIYFPLL